MDHYLIERDKHYLGQFKDGKQPWYFQLNFWGPHEPYFVPSEWLHKYDDVEIPEWPNFHDPQGSQKPKIHDLKRGNVPDWESLVPVIKHYYGEVSHIDDEIGQLISWLKQNDLYDNTLIIFGADHGESLGIHGGLFDKAIFMYEETCSIPLMAKLPKQTDARSTDGYITSADIYSTILDYAGLDEQTRNRDGQSFRPLLENQPTPDWPDTVVTECSGIGSVLFSQRMLRHGDFKYVFNSGDIDELYDLQHDPHEQVNLVDNVGYQTTLHDLRLRLRDWMIAHHDNLIFEFNHLRLAEAERKTE